MTEYLVRYICNSLKPLSEVENPDFCALLKKAQPGYKIPSRKYFSSKILPATSSKLYSDICIRLNPLPTICLTVDIWTNRTMRAYIGITGHFIEDYQLQGVMLACRRFEGIHTAENVLTNYEDIITQFNLQGKVGYIITDNAANMLKAFVKLPGAELERGDDSESDEDEDQDFYIPVDSLEKFYHIPQHISCFIHTLQLVVQDGLKDIGSVSPIISKASKMVSFVRHSCKASSLFENHNKLQAKNDTRWNSTNKMLKSLLNVDPRIIEELDYPSKLIKYEMKIISEITAILTPFELATMKSQAQNSVTSSLIIPCIRGIRAELKELFTTYKSKMLTTLTSSLERRLLKYEEEDIFKLAATLDPRWKLDWCDNLEANYIKDLITKKLCEMILHVQSDTLVSETESIAPPKKRCKLFSFMGDGDASVKQ